MTSAALPDPVWAAARTRPDAPAVITLEKALTYAELDRRIEETVQWLRDPGFRGFRDRFALYRPADADSIVFLLAAFRTGRVVCPISTRLPPAAVPDLLKQVGVQALVAAPDAAWDGLTVLDPADADRPLSRSAPKAPQRDAPWKLTDPATLVFTSGSTGTPKVALHTLGAHVASAEGSVAFFGLGPGDRWLLNLPLYHVGGLAVLVRCVLAGAAVVLPEARTSVEETVRAHGVTHLSLVATQLLRVLQGNDPEALAGTNAVLLGGSAVPPGLLAEAHALGLPVHASYGLTEMASTVTATPPGASLGALGTSGVVLPNREVQIADDGEILVRGATLFTGYVEAEATHRPARAGWFQTGDLGRWTEVDGQRMLQVVGRKDHLFISGGENVQPEEIEAALGQIEGVRRAVVVPAADAEFGQRPVAFVDAERWTPEAWRDGLAGTLARFKIPDAFHPWPDEAETGMKVNRTAMRERAARLQSLPSDHDR